MEETMSKDKIAQITVRNLHKMTKADVRYVAHWLERQARTLKSLTAKDQMWLIGRKEYAPIFNMGLMK
jgi:hypothetical protein